ncbi:MAG: hypothetical protein J6P05_02835 [Lachnospiraceae bacterium]|nr:hypothetical protein [Lachnospiraceae bacterium]
MNRPFFMLLLCFSLILGNLSFAFAEDVSADSVALESDSYDYEGSLELESASENGAAVVRIGSAEDLNILSEKSKDENYTQGRIFILEKDIDFGDAEFKPISVFAGVLDGKGHRISGFKMNGKGSEIAFVRSLASSGQIVNLTVSADVTPRGRMKNIGGIAGENRGLIESCAFYGSVLGKEAVGGIAGHNLESGHIANCVNWGRINGTRRTGGITGFNEGVIADSENHGLINAEKQNAWEQDDERNKELEKAGLIDDEESNISRLNPDAFDDSIDDFEDLVSHMTDLKINYTGGIAGASSGIVFSCKNEGTVGYSHTGYKTGGIVGYERGILAGSENQGVIFGRKDVGGIAGQMEPYVENAYKRDAFREARDDVDRLVELTEELHNSAKNVDDKTQGHIDALRATADLLRETTEGYKGYYRQKDDAAESALRSYTDDLRSKINQVNLDLNDEKANKAIKSLRKDIDDIEEIMDAAERAASRGVDVDMSNYTGRILRVTNDSLRAIDKLLAFSKDSSGELKDFKASLENVRGSANSLDDYVRALFDSYKSDIRVTDDDLSSKIDLFADGMDVLSEGLKDSDSIIRGELDKMTSQLKKVNNTMNRGFDELDNELNRIRSAKDTDEIFDDISDDADSAAEKGVISDCLNLGSVRSDINGGGIIGTSNLDLDLQSDFEVVSSGQVSLKYNRTKKATLIGCKNYGDIEVKNDYAGGIAGKMDSVAILQSENYGRVAAEDGGYAGGIVGKSGYVVRNCYSMSPIEGKSYLGGIAGIGTKLYDNYAMADIDKAIEDNIGSIAGGMTSEEDEEAEARSNYFVNDGPGAINGLTFEGEATAMEYEDFISMNGIPEEFRRMRVSFFAQGQPVVEIGVQYGEAVSRSEFPPLPEEDEKLGYWEYKDLSSVRQNTTVNAVYIAKVSTIASDEALPVLLVSGNFYRGSTLSYEKKEKIDVELPAGYSNADYYKFEIDSKYPGISASEMNKSYTLRLLADDIGEGAVAAISTDEGIETVPTSKDGRYLVFILDSAADEFYILWRLGKFSDNIWAVALGGAGVLAVIVIIKRLIKRGNR